MFMTDVKTHFSWSRLQAFLLDDEELELSLPHTPHSKYHSPGYLAKVVKTTLDTQQHFLYPNCFAYFGNILKHKVIKMNPSEPGESVTNGQTRNVQPPASAALRAKQQRPKKGETVVGWSIWSYSATLFCFSPRAPLTREKELVNSPSLCQKRIWGEASKKSTPFFLCLINMSEM